MEQVLPGVQVELGRQLAKLTRAIQQVAARGKDEAADATPAAAAAEAWVQDAALQQALSEAAERIRDFQRRAEHQAQQLQLEAALSPLRAVHEEECGRLREALAGAEEERDALQPRLAAAEAAQVVVANELISWQQRATAAQDQLDATLRQHNAAMGELQQALTAAEEREQAAAVSLQQAQAAAAAETSGLQRALAEQQAAAAQAAEELVAATIARSEEQARLSSRHQEQQAVWAGELKLLRLQAAESKQAAAVASARATTADGHAVALQAEVQRLGCELEASRQEVERLGAVVGQAREQGADLGARLQAAEQEAAAARRRVEQLQQQLLAAAKHQKEQAAQAASATKQQSKELRRLEAELSDARAEHAATRCALYTAKQAAVEHEQQHSASEARHKLLQGELASQKQQASQLSAQLNELHCEQVAAARAAAAQQSQATAAAAELRGQLADARKAAELALQEVAQAQLACKSQVQLLQQTQEQQLAGMTAAAAAKLAEQQQEAAAALAAHEAALQAQLAKAAACREQEVRQLQEQQAATASAQAAQWEALCTQLADKLQQLAGNLRLDPQQVQLRLDDAVLAPAGLQNGGMEEQASDAVPDAMAATHAGVQQLYGAALELRSQYAAAQLQAASLQQLVAGLQQQAAEENSRWQQRLERELRQQDTAWDLRNSERAAAVAEEWRAKLAATEDRLQAELAQVTRTLAIAQQNREELEQQCSRLAAELLDAQQLAAQGLEAAAERAAAQLREAQQAAALAAKQALDHQAHAEEALRKEMQGALSRLGEQHTATLRATAAQHQQQAEEARLLAEQAARHHQQANAIAGPPAVAVLIHVPGETDAGVFGCSVGEQAASPVRMFGSDVNSAIELLQELAQVEDAWQRRWATEAARLQQQHADELAAAATKQRQAQGEVEQRHLGEVTRLKDAIAMMERSERQLLKARAVLEARVAELEAALETAQQEADSGAESMQLATEAAVAAAHADLRQQVQESLAEKDRLLDHITELQGRIGRDPRPSDLTAIASLEAQVAGLQQQLASQRSHLAALASPPRSAGSGHRSHLPPLSSVGAGLPIFPPPPPAAAAAQRRPG